MENPIRDFDINQPYTVEEISYWVISLVEGVL